MSDKDIFTDNDRPVSPFSQDDSSLDSISSNTSNPGRNPYENRTPNICNTLTTQQLYTETNRATQHSITQWLHQKHPQSQQPALNPSCLPTTKLQTKRQQQQTIQPPLHQLLASNHWGDVPTKNPVYFRVITKNVNSLSTVENSLLWCGVVHAMLELDAHVLCIQEPNLNWTDSIR